MMQGPLEPLSASTTPIAFMLRARVCLRTHSVSCGIVAPLDPQACVIDLLHGARRIWREAGQRAPLAISARVRDPAEAGELADQLKAAAQDPRATQIDVRESEIDEPVLAGLERLRARGFAIVLRCAPDFPLALDTRARRCFSAIAMPAPRALDAFLDLEGWRTDNAARRMQAAAHAGLSCIAENVADGAEADTLMKAGFHEAEGPFATAPRPYTAARAGRTEIPSSFSNK
jgi:hypothetical protein